MTDDKKYKKRVIQANSSSDEDDDVPLVSRSLDPCGAARRGARMEQLDTHLAHFHATLAPRLSSARASSRIDHDD